MANLYWKHGPADAPIKLLNFELPQQGQKPSYPSEWFLAHPNLKPSIKLMNPNDATLPVLAGNAKQQLSTQMPDLEILMVFIAKLFDEYPETCNEEWKSFGRVIAAKGAPVRVKDIISIDYSGANNLSANITADPNEYKGLAIAICCLYRYSSITDVSYLSRMADNFRAKLKAHRMVNLPVVLSGVDNGPVKIWNSDPKCRMLMAAIDMFLNKYSSNPLSECRLGTIVSRFKDHTVLTAYENLCKELNIEPCELALWLFTTETSKSYRALMKPGEELGEENSYAPYFMELGLARKSPYSAATNPDLHFMIHCIGSFVGITRSKNAKIVGVPNMTTNISNALIISYAFNKIGKLRYQGSSPIHLTATVAKVNAREEDILKKVPTTLSLESWLTWLNDIHFIIPEFIRQPVARSIRAWDQQRPGTVGRHIRQLVVSWINDKDYDNYGMFRGMAK